MLHQRPSLRVLVPFVAVLMLGVFAATARADVIFSNLAGGNQGITTTDVPQIGDEVTAAGTARYVNELDMAFTSQGIAVTADLQAFLYANDGTAGAPGTLLWQSAVMPGVAINSVNDLVAFNVPSILVPNTFTFTGAITNASGVVGYVPGSGASTGTFDQPWVGSSGSFNSLQSNFEIQGQVIASPTASTVPLPSSLLGGSVLIAALWAFNRLQTKREPQPIH